MFNQYDTAFGAEGPYLGAALINPDGSGQEPLSVPIDVEVHGPAWSPAGERLLANSFSPRALRRPGSS